METMMSGTRASAVALIVIAAAFAAGIAGAIAVRAPFEYDEAVYAVQARAWARGTPATGIAEYRPPGIPAIGAPIVAAGGKEYALRMTGLTFGVLAVIGVFTLAASIAGPRAAIVAAAGFAAAPTVQTRSAQFLTDVPATALLVLCALAMWHALERNRVLLLPLVAAPLAVAAYYVRYGSALPMAAMALVALVVWRDRLPVRWLLLAGAVAAVLVAPHLVESTVSFGAPWKRASFAVHAAGRDYVGEGLLDYAVWLPFALAGPIAGLLMLAGLARAAIPRLRAGCGRAPAFLIGTALAHLVPLGLIAHGEARFVFFPVALLCVAGAAALPERLPQRLDVALAGVLALALVTAGVVAVATARRADERRGIVPGAARIAATDLGEDCVLLARREAEVTWYSGCATYLPDRVPAVVRPDRAIVFTGDDPDLLPEGATSSVELLGGVVEARIYDLP